MSASGKTTSGPKKNNRRRSNSVGASPALRSFARKREREQLYQEEPTTGETEEEPAHKMSRSANANSSTGATKTGAEIAALIGVVNQLKSSVDSLRQDMPTKEDLSRVEDNIKMQLDTNTKDIQKLFSLREEDSRDFKAKVMEVVGNEEGIGSTRDSEQYFLARRSLRIWPVQELAGSLELGCKEFMMLTLDMPEDVVNGLSIENTRRIQQPRRSKIESEVLVRFSDANTRDIVQSYALNLARHAGRAGIRLEIPPQLMGTFRLFEQHAGTLRQQYPEGFKRSIKFDDINRDLVMDIKVPTASKWHRFNRREIEQASRKHQSSGGPTQLSKNDVSERYSILHPGVSSKGARVSGNYVEVDDEESSNE